MRKLSLEEIERFASRTGVRKMAVENFLMTMGGNEDVAVQNLLYGISLYGWDIATVQAILDGINLACRSR